MMGVNLSRLSLGAAMLAMALLASGCASMTTDTSTNTPSLFESDLAKAQQGNALFQHVVAECYRSLSCRWGEKTPRYDMKKAIYWYRKSAGQGYGSAQYDLGVLYKNGEGVKRDYKKAIYWYSKAAEQEYSSAQYDLGVLYYYGEGVKRDYKKAIYWYSKAAEQGLKDAQNALGVLYKNGTGVKRDYKKAIYWYRKAAERGDIEATLDLGALYKNGEGVRDYKKAIYWYRKAAERGDIEATLDLGALYKNRRDYKKAIYWYSKAAERGFLTAKYNLGVLYKNGKGVRDDKKAIYWYRKAADQGYEDAQNALFDLIKERITRGDKRMLHEQIVAANGQDAKVAKASKAMLEKLLQSGAFIVAEEFANQGRSDAQFMMGQAYRLGRGVKKNAGLAIFWYKKAAEQGSLKAEAEIAKLAN